MERLAYMLLTLLPALVRIMHLGARTLTPAEARTATRAWQQAQGLHPVLDAGNPLLFSLQTLSFWVAGGSDALVRVWPLLATAALPLTLYLMRHWLGRWPALIAATLLTLSPLVNAFARRGDATNFALLAAGLALAGWARWQDERSHGIPLMLTSAVLALLSGPAGFSVLLALSLFLILAHPAAPAQRFRLTAANITPALILLLTGGTYLFIRADALGLVAVTLTQWLHAFSLAPKHLLFGFIRMAADEPVLSLFGLMAVITGIQQKANHDHRALSAAAALATLIAILHGPDAANSRAVAAFFLALPTASFLHHRARSHDFTLRSLEQPLLTAILIMLSFLVVYALTAFAHSSDGKFILLALITALMGLSIIGVFIWFIGWPEIRGALLSTGLILTLLFGSGMLWALAFNSTLPTLARITPTESLPGVPELIRTIGDISQHNTGDRHTLAIQLIPGTGADDVIQWYLRDAAQFSIDPNFSQPEPAPIILAPAQSDLNLTRYAGETIALSTHWGLNDLHSAQAFISWFFTRHAPFPPPTVDSIELWVQGDMLSLSQQP
jgi:hypothetical protein